MEKIKNTLYALNKDRTFSQWQVFVDGSQIVVEFGKLGGKIQTKRTVAEPKNVGRANETSAEEQAILEAQSKWEKQVRLGYRETTEELETEEVMSPMLAHDYLKRGKSISYPAFYQPKLDGLRCLVTFDESGEPVFNSRGNKTYPVQGQIVEQMKALRAATGFNVFDGELYLHGLSLQKIVSLAKKWRSEADIQKEMEKDLKKAKKSDPNAELSHPYDGYQSSDLEFHIFDIPSDKVWFSDDDVAGCRYEDLYKCANQLGSKLSIVFSGIVTSEAEAKQLQAKFMVEGYEGLMLRNFLGRYEFGQRSADLQKWKEFQTIEAKVLSVDVDKNAEGVLNCVLQSGVTFRCKMKGSHMYRKYENMLKMVDCFITISFQAYTEDGAPQFPVGLTKRDVDPQTWRVLE